VISSAWNFINQQFNKKYIFINQPLHQSISYFISQLFNPPACFYPAISSNYLINEVFHLTAGLLTCYFINQQVHIPPVSSLC
jgi:hypothetical protein